MSENVSDLLSSLGSELEQKFISNGRIAAFFEDCENLYLAISLDFNSDDKSLSVFVKVETDGSCDDNEETEESINDYIFDNGLTSGLIAIFGDEGYEEIAIEVSVSIDQI